MSALADKLVKLNACSEAVEWAKTQRTHKEAWANCERGDWMLWLLGNLSGLPESKSRKPLVLCACQCARLALPYVANNEHRPRIAIETAEAWCNGDASINEVRAAAYAAPAVVDPADAAYVANAAAYAADAAYAAYAANAAAYAAANAATNAANAATNAADTACAAYVTALRQCANIVRKHYPKPPRLP